MALDRRWTLVALAAITLVGAWLRFSTLDSQSFWFDESVTWQQTRGNFLVAIFATVNDNYPPLHNLIVWPFTRLLGDAEWVLRLPSAIAGTLNIVALYVLTARLGGRTAGLIAATLLALSGFHLWYSQEARTYALLALLATLFAWTALRYMQSRHHGGWMIAAGIGLLYTHPFGTLSWLSIVAGIWLAARAQPAAFAQPVRPFLMRQLVVALAFLPWAVILLWRAVVIIDGGFWIEPVTLPYLWVQLIEVTSGWTMLVLLLIGTAIAIWRATHPARRETVPAIIILAAWTLLPALLAILASLLTEPIFLARYIIASLPPFIALAALGLGSLATRPIGFAIVAVLAIAVPAETFRQPLEPRADWRGIAAILRTEVGPDDCIATAQGYTAVVLRYYYRSPTNSCLVRLSTMADLQKLDDVTGRTFVVLNLLRSRDRVAFIAHFAGRPSTLRELHDIALLTVEPK